MLALQSTGLHVMAFVLVVGLLVWGCRHWQKQRAVVLGQVGWGRCGDRWPCVVTHDAGRGQRPSGIPRPHNWPGVSAGRPEDAPVELSVPGADVLRACILKSRTTGRRRATTRPKPSSQSATPWSQRRARDAERDIARGQYRAPLHGIPYTLKDVIATKGIRTTFGNPKGVDYRPQESATVHTLLEAAGGILMDKVVSEIGRGSSGPVGCRNPWDLTRSPGTSSSGSGAAVAASLGLASIGSDTGGSVRHPASNSGLVGMKVTFGRISRFGVWAACWSTDQAGPLTKTVEDNAILLEILGVYDPQDPVSIHQPSYDYRASLKDDIKGIRVGVPMDDWVWKDWLSEEEEAVVQRALGILETLGASVTDIRLPVPQRRGPSWRHWLPRRRSILTTILEEQRYHAVILSMHGTPARNSQVLRHRGCCSRTHTRAARRLWLEVIWQRSSTASHVAIGLG